MSKKNFAPVLSSTSSISHLSKPPVASKPKKSSSSSSSANKSCYASLEKVYRLPPSLKRTEEMIAKSVLHRQISSKILDIVGDTLRVKNTNQQPQYFCSPTNFSQFLKYKEYASSEFLETLYEEEGEESFETRPQTQEVSSLSINTEHCKSVLDTSMYYISQGNNCSTKNLDKITSQSSSLVEKGKAYSSSLMLKDPKKLERLSLSPNRSKSYTHISWEKSLSDSVFCQKIAYATARTTSKGIDTEEDEKVSAERAKTSEDIKRKSDEVVKRPVSKTKKNQEKENLGVKRLDKSALVLKDPGALGGIWREQVLSPVRQERNMRMKSEGAEKIKGGFGEEGFMGKSIGIKTSLKENDIKGKPGKSKQNKSMSIAVKSPRKGEKSKLAPKGPYDALRRSLESFKIKSQLLEPRRRNELEKVVRPGSGKEQ